MVRQVPESAAARIRCTASAGSVGSPSVRANTLAPPPGTAAIAGRRPGAASPAAAAAGSAAGTWQRISPLTTSLTVPSPPKVTTRSNPASAEAAASSRAWPR